MAVDWKTILDAFKFAPAILSLLVVIYLMYRLLMRKEDSISKVIELSKEDQKRNEKILTLLDILVNKGP